MSSNAVAPDAVLRAALRAQLWCSAVGRALAARARRDERGDVYSSTIMVAVAVVVAITVGGILLAKFSDKANHIDTETPTVTVAG